MPGNKKTCAEICKNCIEGKDSLEETEGPLRNAHHNPY